MRITIEIEDKKLEQIRAATRQRKKSPAVAMALDEFLENRKRQAFLAKVMAGRTSYAASNDEVEGLARIEE